jgi:quinol monooxygenase YgiN
LVEKLIFPKENIMIVVRFVFQAKWGKADEVVDEFKKNAELMREALGSNVRVRLLTDLSGPFHTVVQELEVESLAEWERLRAAMFNNPELQDLQADLENPFEAGRTEFYTLEATY